MHRNFIRGYGGIGRHDGFRIHWATVQVQVLLPVPNKTRCAVAHLVLFGLDDWFRRIAPQISKKFAIAPKSIKAQIKLRMALVQVSSPVLMQIKAHGSVRAFACKRPERRADCMNKL